MSNFDILQKENIRAHNSNWMQTPDHANIMIII